MTLELHQIGFAKPATTLCQRGHALVGPRVIYPGTPGGSLASCYQSGPASHTVSMLPAAHGDLPPVHVSLGRKTCG